MSLNRPYGTIEEIPQIIPIFPLAGAVLLPRSELPLNIFEPRYLALVESAIATDRMIGMIQPQQNETALSELFSVGCVGRITRFVETGDGRYLITLSGVSRFSILKEVTAGTPYRRFQVDYLRFSADLLPGAGENSVDRAGMISMLRTFAEASNLEIDWGSIDAAPTETLVNALAMMCPFGSNEKQALIEAIDLKTRAETLITLAKIDLAERGRETSKWH
ncbi:MAG: peptidase S16 [Alphaproteobacteria bacterium]|jgi:Lon protease-like protein|nr:peptidase S16 [Alphaproteobacteria bacterium]